MIIFVYIGTKAFCWIIRKNVVII